MMTSEIITEKDGTLISSQDRGVGHWTERLEPQINWHTATLQLLHMQLEPKWDVGVDLPTYYEVEKAVLMNVKRWEPAGREVFMNGGGELLVKIMDVLGWCV
ncbi:unnamed protein product [Heterobilharzia americana]|nr:unnamed protein product [Heterobilharzia americana]